MPRPCRVEGKLQVKEITTRLDSSADLNDPLPNPNFEHLQRMTDHRGLWEHALYNAPRKEHGYCTDDNARALIVVSRQPNPTPQLIDMAIVYLAFLRDAELSGGGFHNRRNSDGDWVDEKGSDDSQGRALWALGTVANNGPDASMRQVGFDAFDRLPGFDSPYLRSNAFAVLGLSEMLLASPDHRHALAVLEECVGHLVLGNDVAWPWPEDRLTYDNARVPEALLAAGALLARDDLIDSGLRLLDWLVATEKRDEHFSFTPVGGWTSGEPRPGFDQQPVEAAAMADACSRAWSLTGDSRWKSGVEQAARWFLGANDTGATLYDPRTGGCGDGLGPDHINFNQGAESTLAALSVLQQAKRVGALRSTT